MSSLRTNGRVTDESMVQRLDGKDLKEHNLRHPRVERIIGREEEVTFRIFNDLSQAACYDVTIEDGGSSRKELVRIGYVKLKDDDKPPRSFDGEQQELGYVDIPAGNPTTIHIDPHMCCVLVATYEWAAGSTDPRLVYSDPTGDIDVNVTHEIFDSPAITRPGWTARTP